MSRWAWLALVAWTVSACGDEVSSGGAGAASAGGGGGGAAGGAGGSGLSGGGGGGVGGSPSCSQAEPCEQGVCLYAQGSCDPSALGVCQLGFSCDGPPTGPLCQCDGNVLEGMYAVCEMWGQGEPYDDPEPCATGTFACGSLACTRHVEVCVETLPGVPGPTEYDCVPVSDIAGSCAHGIADCSCLDLSPLYCDAGGAACDCASDEDGQETVTVALP